MGSSAKILLSNDVYQWHQVRYEKRRLTLENNGITYIVSRRMGRFGERSIRLQLDTINNVYVHDERQYEFCVDADFTKLHIRVQRMADFICWVNELRRQIGLPAHAFQFRNYPLKLSKAMEAVNEAGATLAQTASTEQTIRPTSHAQPSPESPGSAGCMHNCVSAWLNALIRSWTRACSCCVKAAVVPLEQEYFTTASQQKIIM
eukprot:2343123-Pleurochrysis_carterae.AAC.1